jgi:hypothetical protein
MGSSIDGFCPVLETMIIVDMLVIATAYDKHSF